MADSADPHPDGASLTLRYWESAEYQQLSQEILHERDINRARRIAERLDELRGPSRLPEYPRHKDSVADILARLLTADLPTPIPDALCNKCKEYHRKIYPWHYTWLCARHWAEARRQGGRS